MLDWTSPDFWIVACAGLAVGVFVGWLITSLSYRRSNSGQTAAQLREEMDTYRAEVNSHFARTADLFKETTEKYRDLYEHLSGGAQDLCQDLPDKTRVEFRPGRLLAQQASETEAETEVREPPRTGP
ncbi:MAG: DUF1043 family protein [Gammaproteobacteria bacterium]|nr:DUF1043 family protein [Gammaproteobacteria bacterium]NND59732.1 DUF1043 family protein [Gammaproteobacteria bacterium]